MQGRRARILQPERKKTPNFSRLELCVTLIACAIKIFLRFSPCAIINAYARNERKTATNDQFSKPNVSKNEVAEAKRVNLHRSY